MPSFAAATRGAAKIRNHEASFDAKVAIRQNVLDAIGADEARVFEAYAGAGEMHRAVWHRASSCVGCDLEWFSGSRLAFVADNRRVLRTIDLGRFNIFDLDAFGSPWEQAIIVAARRRVAAGERIGMVLTDGSGLTLKQGGLPLALAELAGLSQRLTGVARWQEKVIDRALTGLMRRMRCRIDERWQASGKTGAAMRYIGLVISGAEALGGDSDNRAADSVAGRA